MIVVIFAELSSWKEVHVQRWFEWLLSKKVFGVIPRNKKGIQGVDGRKLQNMKVSEFAKMIDSPVSALFSGHLSMLKIENCVGKLMFNILIVLTEITV